MDEWRTAVYNRGPVGVAITWDPDTDEPPMVQAYGTEELLSPQDADRLARALLAAVAQTQTGQSRR
ncbi:hypothetical protein N864_05805 [Intrasporangium chromatireducens Q5-1]|uniref:Uncharacterized protein n=1 Tax=Intrasporangium chromatireducens Q5-1 TaxID=584657 RepID=W9GLP0_9MICO|nr:hypothetical protein [Intrasporangium chromatireducens]EWT04824.1 hypothetical protein N864_05805 [Intrasporangium chromatireducens Q5-1]